MTSFEHELTVALEAAGLAGKALRDRYARFQAIPDAPASISTEADRESQEIILGYLRRIFSSDALCAEEATPTLADAPHTGDRLWIVDPIDGTRGFARKNGQFSVMVAFVSRGEVGVGVVLEPALGRLTFAIRGGGCWRRDDQMTAAAPCRVSTAAELSQATLTQSHSRTPGTRSAQVQAINPARVIETYSAGIKLAQVARGDADIYLNTYDAFHDWDIAAGDILVHEAGGKVSGLGGQELRYGLPGAWQRGGLLASNKLLHEAAVEALKQRT
jgi:3'(2'), 5'-bisphosphate nucleotidase